MAFDGAVVWTRIPPQPSSKAASSSIIARLTSANGIRGTGRRRGSAEQKSAKARV